MKPKDLEMWLESPVTHIFQDLLKEHFNAVDELITDSVKNVKKLKDLDWETLAEYRGQLHALARLQDLNDFMIERVKSKEVI